MQNKDWFETGEDILKSVVNAVDSQDFSGLSKDIENRINTTIDRINERLGENGRIHYGQNKMNSSTYRQTEVKNSAKSSEIPKAQRNQVVVVPQKKLPQLYAKKPPGTYSGPTLKVLGIVGAALTGPALAILAMVGIATGTAGVWLASGIVGTGFLGSIGMVKRGVTLEGRVHRFKQYVQRLGQKQYCNIELLASAVGKKVSYVRKDIRKMIDNRYFLQGHLDDKGTTLITSDAMYSHYLESENSRRLREIESKKEDTPLLEQKNTSENSGYPAEVQKVLDEGNEYIRHIRECNDAIPGEIMSQKLATLEDIMIRIFEQIKKNPANVSDVQKMMKYYLPSTRKLIDTYRELDGQPSFGDNNVANTKKEIESTLDVINEAFGKLFDDMFEDAAWDISTEISTMKTMLAKEGLTGGNDFKLD